MPRRRGGTPFFDYCGLSHSPERLCTLDGKKKVPGDLFWRGVANRFHDRFHVASEGKTARKLKTAQKEYGAHSRQAICFWRGVANHFYAGIIFEQAKRRHEKLKTAIGMGGGSRARTTSPSRFRERSHKKRSRLISARMTPVLLFGRGAPCSRSLLAVGPRFRLNRLKYPGACFLHR